MPYLAHFGLRDHPFTLTPNTQQYFPTSGNTQVLQSLEYGIRRNSGIMKVVGDVGTGKTLLCRLLLRQLEEGTEVAYLNAPQAEGDALIAMVCHEFGLETPAGASRADLLRDLNAFLLDRHAEETDCVLVVDEAQALGAAGLETIRLLSNLETETAKLLQIVLFGQTELDALLARPDLRQLNQRIAFGFGTGPFSAAEAAAYISHRLRQARQEGIEWRVIEPKAVDAIIKASGGVPRVINILCDKALLIAYGEGQREVSRAHVRAAIKDSPTLVQADGGGGGTRVALAAGFAGLVAGVAVAAALLFGDGLSLSLPLKAAEEAPAAEPAPVPEAPAPGPRTDVAPEPAPAPTSRPAPAARPAAVTPPAAAPEPPAEAPTTQDAAVPEDTARPAVEVTVRSSSVRQALATELAAPSAAAPSVVVKAVPPPAKPAAPSAAPTVAKPPAKPVAVADAPPPAPRAAAKPAPTKPVAAKPVAPTEPVEEVPEAAAETATASAPTAGKAQARRDDSGQWVWQ